jgi:cell division GTPase FtsZ
MSTIGGPGGINGPKGPGGPREIDDVADAHAASETSAAASTAASAAPAAGTDVQALAAEVAAGRLTHGEAIDRMIDAMAGPELDADARAELRELLSELVANDPYLQALADRI